MWKVESKGLGVEGQAIIENFKIKDMALNVGIFNLTTEVTVGGGIGTGLEVNASLTGNINFNWDLQKNMKRHG